MGAKQLSAAARAYVASVIVAGGGIAFLLALRANPRAWDWNAILLFGALGVLASALSVTYQGFLSSTTVHQIGTSFLYALFFLVDPAAVTLALCVMTVADWVVNRRRALIGVFNTAQLCLSLGAAVIVREWIRPGFTTLDGVDPRTMLAAAASLLAFSAVNHVLTHVVVSLASHQPILRLDLGTRTGILNEILCITSGLGTAVFWWVSPWLVILGALPIWLLMLLLMLLSRREKELEMRQSELRSLQELGLEIGSELDAELLHRAVVRIATETLHGSGALLAALAEEGERLDVLSHHGVSPSPPDRVPVSRLIAGLFASQEIRRIENLASQREQYPELSCLRASGLLCAPLRMRGRHEGLLVVLRGEERRPFDEDDVRRLENLVRFVDMALSNARLVSDLKQVQTQLLQTEKMSALGMLVSGVAHELNNPLTSVLGYTQLLLSRGADGETRKMLERVATEADRAGRIVKNLLTFSRNHKSERKPVDLNAVLDQVLDLRGYELHVSNVEVVRRLSPGLPRVNVDPYQFQQVFLNLITNAEHAIRETGRRGRIVVETRRTGDAVRVSLADNGGGIPEENLRKIFLPFFTTKEVGKGTGLGLSICYGIVQEHGGRIAVESRAGEGTTFHVEIPGLPDEEDRTAGAEALAAAAQQEPVAGGRLLVVDDEEAIADLVRDVLEAKGWDVHVAHDGTEALRTVADARFDVLLVDMKMPGMDGQAFYRALREARPELAGRIVFSTGDAGSDATARFLDEAGNPVLGKPYDLDALVRTVSRVAGGPSPAP